MNKALAGVFCIVSVALLALTGYGQSPDINVQGNGISIINGDTTPSTGDGTDFGDVELGSSVTHTFVIQNLGDVDLNLTGTPLVAVSGPDAADFTVTQQPTTPIQSGSSTTFQIQFTPGGLGVRAATVTIENNDPDEDPYTFALQGTGVDTIPPEKPALPDLADASDKGESNSDNITNDNTPTFQGGAGAVEGGSTVTVRSSIDGVLGTTVADADGSWSFTAPTMSDGSHQITVTATDAAGNESVPSDPLTVLIDTQPPDPPGGRDPVNGTYTNDTSPTLSWAVPSDPGGSGIYKYRVQIDGPVTRDHYTTSTSYTPILGSEGTYTWRLYAIDVAGNDSDWTSYWTFTIDVTKPSITAVTPSPATIAEADVGTNAFSITVDYNEPMDTSVDPVISFPVEDPSTTISFNHGSWTDSDTYVAYYDVVDADQELANIDVLVSGGKDPAGNVQDQADYPDLFSIDTIAPQIVSITSTTPDGYYSAGSDIDVTVNFSEPVTLAGGTIDVGLDSGTTVSIAPFGPANTASTTYTVSPGENSCDLDAVNISLNGGSLTDEAGNNAVIALPSTTIADGSDITVDTTDPDISWTVPLPSSPQYVDSDCSITIPIDATVSDNCCISASDVTKEITVTNASVTDTVTITQVDGNHVQVAGDITVSGLTACPAVLTVGIGGTDCCGNANSWVDSVEFYDTTSPVITNLVVADHVPVSPDCCETVVPFTADVTDACCITPAGITITASNPTDNATIAFDPAHDVTFTQVSQGHVQVAGIVHVRCVTSCPARVEVHIEAVDCCGNAAAATSTDTEGRVYDFTPPTAVDDPSGAGDTSAILDQSTDVRMERDGQYRLMVRQNTPIRIDVMANDTDNCSACTCCGTMRIHDIVDPSHYGTVTIEDDQGDCNGGSVIRYAPYRDYIGPDQFSYRIEDACGNVSEAATVYLEVVRRTELNDVYTTTYASTPVAVVVRMTDLWIPETQFVFDISAPPTHGVLLGDLAAITYTPPGRTVEDLESYTLRLFYVPAANFVGRDRSARVRCFDPFGGSSVAGIDVLVSPPPRAGAPPRPIQVHRGEVVTILAPPGAGATITALDGANRAEGAIVVDSMTPTATRFTLATAVLPAGKYRVTIKIGPDAEAKFVLEVIER